MDPENGSTATPSTPPVGHTMKAAASTMASKAAQVADRVRVNPQNAPVVAWIILLVTRLTCLGMAAFLLVVVAPRGLADTNTIDGCWVDTALYAAPDQMLECRKASITHTQPMSYAVVDKRTGGRAPTHCLIGECGEVHRTECDVHLESLAACTEFLAGSKQFMGGGDGGAIPLPPSKCYSHATSTTAKAMFLTNYMRMYNACPDHITMKVSYLTDEALERVAGAGVGNTIVVIVILLLVGTIWLLPDVMLIQVIYTSIRGGWVSARTALTLPELSSGEEVTVRVETSNETGPPLVTRRRVWKEVARIVGTQFMARILCVGVAVGIVLWLLYSPSVDYLHTEELVVYDQCYIPSPDGGKTRFSVYPDPEDLQSTYDPCTSLRVTSFSERDAAGAAAAAVAKRGDLDDLSVVVVPDGLRCRQKRCGYYLDVPCRMEWGNHEDCLQDLHSWNGSSCIARVSVNNKPAFLSEDSELDRSHLDADGAERAHPDAQPCGNILHTRQPLVQFLRPHIPRNETTPVLQTRRHRAHLLDELDREAVTEHLKAVGRHKSWFYRFKKQMDLQLRRLYRNDALRDTVIYTILVVVGVILPEFVLLTTLRSMDTVTVSDRKKR